ncbi:MAG: PEP-CTERM sorting domain-containing protein, partial [Roseimicrobium sp.]
GRLQVGVGGTFAQRAVGQDTGLGGAGQGATVVGDNGFIGGTGTIQGQASVTNHVMEGTIQPGDYTGAASGIGKLDVVGNLNASDGTISIQVSGNSMNDATLGGLQAGTGAYDTRVSAQLANYEASVTGTTGGAAHDFLNISGQLTLDGTSQIQVLTEGSYTYVAGDIFDVLDWLSVVGGAFSVGTTTNVGSAQLRNGGSDGDLVLPTLSGGLAWDVQKLLSNGILIVANNVPEPSRALLLLAGLAGALMRRRRPAGK